jgi:hypothetical protein
VTIPITLTLCIGEITPPRLPPGPPHPTYRIQEVSLFRFIEVHEVHPPYSLTFISSIPPLHQYLPHCTYVTTNLSLLISKPVFKGVSRCDPAVSLLSFGPFNPSHCSPSPLHLPPPISPAFSAHPYVLHLHRCDVS